MFTRHSDFIDQHEQQFSGSPVWKIRLPIARL